MRRRVLLTLLSAILVVLVFPPIGWWFLAPIAWIPLFIAHKDTSLRASFRLGVLHGFISFGATLWWLLEIFGTLAPALWLMLALFTLSFPWITPGTEFPPLRMTSILGVYGMSFIIILLSAFALKLTFGKLRLRETVILFGFLFLHLPLWLSLSEVRTPSYPGGPHPK